MRKPFVPNRLTFRASSYYNTCLIITGKTKRELADEVGCAPGTLWLSLAKRKTCVSTDTISRFCRVVGHRFNAVMDLLNSDTPITQEELSRDIYQAKG